MLLESLTADGHYAEVETGGSFEIDGRPYVKGIIYSKEFPDGIVTFWNMNYDHNNAKLSITDFRIGPEDKLFKARKEIALEYRKAKDVAG